MKASITWPLIVVAFLGLSVGANVALIYYASTDPTFAVERDYYQKAIDWDETAAERAASRRLGWSAELVAAPSRLEVTLRDERGSVIPGAWVEVEAFPYVRGNQVTQGELRERSPGRYELEGSFQPSGMWEIRLRAEVGEDTFVQTFRTEISSLPSLEGTPERS